MPRLRLSLAALGLSLATACAEDPSFVLRWQVGHDPADAENALLSVRQCSELGISRVRVVTTDRKDQSEVDSREFPCFPTAFDSPDGFVPGPDIGAGEYDVTLVGLTRRGLTRKDSADAVLARDKRTVVVRAAGEGQQVSSFRLAGISECDDGIDNDRDGSVDASDLACRQGQPREDLDNSATLFTVKASLLGGNPNATCDGLGIDALRVILDGDLARAQQIPCTTELQSFSAYLSPGEHTWAIQGIGTGGAAVTQTVTGEGSTFTISERGYGFVPIALDLALDDFLAPFSEPLRFTIAYEPYPDAPLTRTCGDVSDQELGTLQLGAIVVTLRDETGTALQTVTLTDADMGDDATFPIEAVCEDFAPARNTSELVWSGEPGQGAYSLTVETWALNDDGGGPCYSNAQAPMQLAPGLSPTVLVPRQRSDGACVDCVKNECKRCEAGVCKL